MTRLLRTHSARRVIRIAAATGILATGLACPPKSADPPPPGDPRPTSPVPVVPTTVKKTCETVWPKADEPSSKLTRKCARYWLRFAYGKHLDADALVFDPLPGIPASMKMTVAQLVRMKQHVQRVCGKVTPDHDFGVCSFKKTPFLKRAEELFWREIQERVGTMDSFAMESIEPELDKIFAGQLLEKDDLFVPDQGRGKPECLWGWVTLWKLRNAVFARHGRPFVNEDLQSFFYRQSKGKRADLEPVQGFKNEMLSPTDRKNIAAIQGCESN